MKGLILKDLYTVFGYRKQYAMVLIFMMIWSLGMKNSGFISMYLLILGGMLVLSSLSTDETSHFNRLALTMPISPQMLVKSKYVLLIIIMGCAAVISMIIDFLSVRLFPQWQTDLGWQGVLVTALLFIATYSVTLPLIYKLGVEKARYVYIGVMLGIGMIVFGVGSLMEKMNIDIEKGILVSDLAIVLISLSVSIIILRISYQCSLKVIQKKEW